MTGATSITVRVPLQIRRRPGRKTVVQPLPTAGADTAIPTRADPALVKALARAFRYQKLLDQGRYSSITEMAAGEKIDRGYLGRLLRLAVLAPDLVEGLLDGRHGADADLTRLMEPLPSEWGEQRAELASSRLPRSPGTPDATARGD
ncbi:hypothetical protein [Crenalkalicoccus roseus]|uniref:hypothetical protein n=1 Tax=Crenalkalicoccus roseus TaxID=1485588 RepID=UPI0010805CC2|nr:hypothetical protein [Crenalkalicoccus roseus]